MPRDNPIGIVGLGFVGSAIRYGWNANCCGRVAIHTYDKDPTRQGTCKNLLDLVTSVPRGPVFVCVPTPMFPDGRSDTSIVYSVLSSLDAVARAGDLAPYPVVIKSTVPPGSTAAWQAEFKSLSLVFNPEFLTEANSVNDFVNQNRIVLGGSGVGLERVAEAYADAFPAVKTVLTDSTTAEMVKYVGNTFLAVKVALANEYYALCQKLGVRYDEMIDAAKLDPRLGTSHWRVPGPDGKKGFSGSCFPKDINALIKIMEDNSVQPHVLKAAWQTNLSVRPERDWEDLKGRAVSYGPKN